MVAAMDTMSSQITNSKQFYSIDVEQDAKQPVSGSLWNIWVPKRLGISW